MLAETMPTVARASKHPRVRTQLAPAKDSSCDENAGQEVCDEFVVASGDASEVLEAAEHALDAVALSVGRLVVDDGKSATGVQGNDGFGAGAIHKLAQAVGVVALVGEQAAHASGALHEAGGHGDVVDVAR